MIDTTVKIGPNDTRCHIGITVMPRRFDTIRFTPLTEKGRKILRMRSDDYRLSMSFSRGADLYDAIGASGYAVQEEIVESSDCDGQWGCKNYDVWVWESSNRPDYSLQSV